MNDDTAQLIDACPKCGCRDLFIRKNFPQKLGLSFVVVAAIAAGCSRSSGNSSKGGGATTTGASSTATGDFGTLKAVCGPGNAKGSKLWAGPTG